MKILIVSDTHRRDGNLLEVIEKTAPFDMMIHLGDTEGSEAYFKDWIKNEFCVVHVVRGNNDFFSDLPAEQEFFIEGHHVFITHGHYYGVSLGEDRIKAEARGRGADIVMYGHTHRPSLEEEKDLVTLNPGSVSYPRQAGRDPSYIVMQADERGGVDFQICYQKI